MKLELTIKQYSAMFKDVMEPENMRSITVLFWRVLILAMICSVVGSVAYGFARYQETSEIFTAIMPQSQRQEPFKRSDLSFSVAAFTARELRYQTLENTAISDPDPSQ